MAKKNLGFTIVELVIVIVVIGILSSLVVTTYAGISNRTKQQRATADLSQLAKIIKIAVNTQNKPLYQITGNQWTLANCYYRSTLPVRPMYQLDQSDVCWTDYRNALTTIGNAANINVSNFMKGDPWGSPYLIDENEMTDSSNPCLRDVLATAGSKGIPYFDTTQTFELGFNIASGKDSSGNPCT